MYTYNNFVFGHDIPEELNKKMAHFDFDFRTKINKKDFEISFPYHGGQCGDDTQSLIFGTIITDDDCNKNYVSEIRNAKESDYIEDYKLFLVEVKKDILEMIDHFSEYDESPDEFKNFTDEVITFLDNNKPEFYSVEASS